MKKQISVIMPVYNAAQFLRPCLESVLWQTEKNFEIIVINDGSTDSSEEIIQSFTDSRIRYFKQENQGVAAARNKALDLTEGDYIVFQDADDLSLPSRFETLKRQFISETIGLVHSDVLLIDHLNRPAGYYSNRNLDQKRALRYFFKIGTPICGGSVMARREAFQDVKYDPALKIGEDNEILSRITQKWGSVHVPEPLYLYRRHGENSARETRYHVVFAHVQKFLEDYSLQELLPELDWQAPGSKPRGLAIIALFLQSRGMYLHVENWISTAENHICDDDSKHFVKAVSLMLKKDFQEALKTLEMSQNQDHIVQNYKGECFAGMGNTANALQCFLVALTISPNYIEPIDNLKGLGGIQNFNIGDITWQKFH